MHTKLRIQVNTMHLLTLRTKSWVNFYTIIKSRENQNSKRIYIWVVANID